MTGAAPICMVCTHRREEPEDPDAENGFTCDAFPDGIPEEIVLGSFDHHDPHPNDHGIQFEQDPDSDLVAVGTTVEER